MYHQIAPADAEGFESYLHVTPDDFERQVRYLLNHKWTLMTLTEAWRSCEQGRAARVAVLTFDDLYQNFVDYAFPVIRKLGVRATAFAIGGLQSDRATVENLPEGICRASNDSLRMLDQNGVEIGAHTMTHRELPALSGDELETEVVQCKRELEKILGHGVTSFCYPRGRYSPRVRQAVAAAGYECATTTLRGNRHDDPFEIKRIRVDGARQGMKLGYTTGWFYDWRNRKRCLREKALFAYGDRVAHNQNTGRE